MILALDRGWLTGKNLSRRDVVPIKATDDIDCIM
jgi:hypothetical protein